MKKNGFTLIELLAVIVIMAVIALIVTPIVTGIIGSSKASADARSAEAYVKSAENYYAGSQINQEKQQKIDANIINDIELNNVTDRQGYVSVNNSGQVKMAIVINNKCYYKQENQNISEITITTDDLDACIANVVPLISKISFTISDPYNNSTTYQVNEGTTWLECLNSGPCNEKLINLDSYVAFSDNVSLPSWPVHLDYNHNKVSVSDAIQSSTTYITSSYVCFISRTKVLTKNGLINIEDIKVGDLVYSYNEITDKYEYNKVINTYINQTTKDKTTITVNGEQITSTSKHLYYTKNRGWVEAYSLTINDEILFSNNTVGHIENISTTSSEGYTVYNISVENAHTYFVGENSILVHNAGTPC